MGWRRSVDAGRDDEGRARHLLTSQKQRARSAPEVTTQSICSIISAASTSPVCPRSSCLHAEALGE